MQAALVVVLVASALGTVVSVVLWIECFATLREAARSTGGDRDQLLDKALEDLTLESVRLAVLIVFLVAAILSAVAGPSELSQQIIALGLISVPILVTLSSLHAWWIRRRLRQQFRGERPSDP